MVPKDYSNLSHFALLPVDMLAVRQILVYSTIAWCIHTYSLAEHFIFMYEGINFYRAVTKSTIHRSFLHGNGIKIPNLEIKCVFPKVHISSSSELRHYQTSVHKPDDLINQALDHWLVAPVDLLQHALEPRLLDHANGSSVSSV